MNAQALKLENLDARTREAVQAAKHAPILLAENDKPAYVIRELTDDDLIDELLAQNPEFLESSHLARQQVAEGKVMTLAEMRAKYEQSDE